MTDERPRRVPTLTQGEVKTVTVPGFAEASKAGAYWNDVGQFIRTNELEIIRPYSLMGLSAFVIADGMTWADTTTETQWFLNDVAIADFQTKNTWQRLRTLCRGMAEDGLKGYGKGEYLQSLYTHPHSIPGDASVKVEGAFVCVL